MGCDIHAYIEYYEHSSTNPIVYCFAKDVSLGRCYTLFARMAGVRGYESPVVDPRGMPTAPEPEVSYEVAQEYYSLVLEDGEYNSIQDMQTKLSSPWGVINYNIIPRSRAEELHTKHNIKYKDSKKNLFPCPSWHTESWLYVDELMNVRQKYIIDSLDFNEAIRGKKRREIIKKLDGISPFDLMSHHFGELEHNMLNATIATMLIIERKTNFKSRLVFWFDS